MKGRDISFGILRCFRSSENECGRFCANGLHHAFDAGKDDAVAQDFSGQEHECGGVGVEPEPACGNGQRVADNGQPGKQKGQGAPALEQAQGFFRRPFLGRNQPPHPIGNHAAQAVCQSGAQPRAVCLFWIGVDKRGESGFGRAGQDGGGGKGGGGESEIGVNEGHGG